MKLPITVGGRTVEVSNPDKVLFGRSGVTKAQLAAYYAEVGPTMLAHVRDRPITLVRYPGGITGDGFFQKHTPDHYPGWIPRVELAKREGMVRHAVVDHPAALVYFAQQNAITPHIGLARRPDLDQPDLFVVDLDPSVSDMGQVSRVAQEVRAILMRAGLVPFVQLTGSKGVHVVAPVAGPVQWRDLHHFGRALATALLQEMPDDVTTEFSKAERGDRIYLDLGRNNYQATFVAPYGVRPYEGAPVATPITWDELDDPDLDARRYTIDLVPDRLARRGDPWADLAASARALPDSPVD